MWRCVSEGIDYPAELRGKLSFDDAYLIQLGLLARYEQVGDKQVGWKVGLTAKAMQAAISGNSAPHFSTLAHFVSNLGPANGRSSPKCWRSAIGRG